MINEFSATQLKKTNITWRVTFPTSHGKKNDFFFLAEDARPTEEAVTWLVTVGVESQLSSVFRKQRTWSWSSTWPPVAAGAGWQQLSKQSNWGFCSVDLPGTSSYKPLLILRINLLSFNVTVGFNHQRSPGRKGRHGGKVTKLGKRGWHTNKNSARWKKIKEMRKSMCGLQNNTIIAKQMQTHITAMTTFTHSHCIWYTNTHWSSCPSRFLHPRSYEPIL